MVMDALDKKFYKNDSQICQLQVEKLYCEVGDENPRTEVHLEHI